MGCGYLPPLAGSIPVQPWEHPGRRVGADERNDQKRLHLPVCVGYTRSLPEVVEASWAHSYWDRGELSQFCEGQSTPELRDAINELAIAYSEVSQWMTDNPAPPKK